MQHFSCLESQNCEHTPDIPLNFSYEVANDIIVNNCVKYITHYTNVPSNHSDMDVKTVEPKVAFLYLKLEQSPKNSAASRNFSHAPLSFLGDLDVFDVFVLLCWSLALHL